MARTANPNREKIAAVKEEIKSHTKNVKTGEKSAKKLVSLNERLSKLQSGGGKRGRPAGSGKVEKKAKGKKAKASSADKFKKKKRISNKRG